jgi:3-oxoacyl-[acyl-carrier protein] reductase
MDRDQPHETINAAVLQKYDLSGRVALVTGAGGGIGRACALLLARAGAYVVCADVDAETSAATAAAIGEHTGRVGRANSVALDVSISSVVQTVVDEVVGQHGHLDILANMAGIMDTSLVIDTTEAAFDRVWSVNFLGTFFCCQAAARHMVQQGRGSIVNTASSSIDIPTPGFVSYAVSKAAVAELTRTLALEVASSGVRVNTIAPGFVHSNMTARYYRNPDGSIDEERRAAVLEKTVQHYPLGILGEPEDIADAVLYLVSDASRYVTGQILRLNGGSAMP